MKQLIWMFLVGAPAPSAIAGVPNSGTTTPADPTLATLSGLDMARDCSYHVLNMDVNDSG